MQITWYGHSAFRLDFGGKAVLIDPFFTGNPGFGGDPVAAVKGISHILLTHGHSDHVGDAIDISKKTGAVIVTNYDLCMWLAAKGVEKFDPMNTGGTTEQGGFTVTMVRADHSSGDIKDGMPIYLGNPCGIIVKAKGEPNRLRAEIDADQACIRRKQRGQRFELDDGGGHLRFFECAETE